MGQYVILLVVMAEDEQVITEQLAASLDSPRQLLVDHLVVLMRQGRLPEHQDIPLVYLEACHLRREIGCLQAGFRPLWTAVFGEARTSYRTSGRPSSDRSECDKTSSPRQLLVDHLVVLMRQGRLPEHQDIPLVYLEACHLRREIGCLQAGFRPLWTAVFGEARTSYRTSGRPSSDRSECRTPLRHWPRTCPWPA